jgi:hypothetical protein
MTLARALEPTPDLCCLPSPHRIPLSVAGMAFNFSKIEISHHTFQHKSPPAIKSQPQPNPAPAAQA